MNIIANKKKSAVHKGNYKQLIQDIHLIAKVEGLNIITDGNFKYHLGQIESFCEVAVCWLDLSEITIKKKVDADRFRSKCRAHLKSIAKQSDLAKNRLIERFKPVIDRLSLNDTEIRFLILALAAYSDNTLCRLCDQIRFRISIEGANILAPALKADISTLVQLITGRSRLHRSGLLIGNDYRNDLGDYLQPSVALFGAFFSDEPLIAEILNRVLMPISAPTCVDKDYSYLLADIAVMESALKTTTGSAHVLIVGPPGVGKTELARFVCSRSGKNGFEVSCSDMDGSPADRAERFRQYSLATEFMDRTSNALLIFDEAEDVFIGDHWMHVQQSKDRHKGWTNRLLESATVPTIWITNSIERIDPAYLRRFDHVIQLKAPPRSVRRRLIESATKDQDVSPKLLDRIADSEAFTPADASRIARVFPRTRNCGLEVNDALIRLASARPGGVPRSQLMTNVRSELNYQIEWLNVNADLPRLIVQLYERGSGTLAFSGPPGTGKTALAAHIAQRLDRPLLTKKASDLISPYVGETEQRIARTFESAMGDEAVLFLDEADSFVRSRAMAQRSWEVSQVNEVLAQLDSYQGVAILATNHADTLDHALQRRIDVKLTFGYLRPEHAWTVFASSLKSLGLESPATDSLIAQRVRGLRNMAVGDFVAVLRGIRLCVDRPSADVLLDALVKELSLKEGDRHPIGFRIHQH